MSKFFDKDGNKLGDSSGNEVLVEGRVVARVQNNELYDSDGRLIGKVVDGEIFDPSGNRIPNAPDAQGFNPYDLRAEDDKSAVAAAAWSILKRNKKL